MSYVCNVGSYVFNVSFPENSRSSGVQEEGEEVKPPQGRSRGWGGVSCGLLDPVLQTVLAEHGHGSQPGLRYVNLDSILFNISVNCLIVELAVLSSRADSVELSLLTK